MAGTTLPLLPAASSAADADIFLLRKSGETSDKKITGSNLKAYIQSDYQTTAAADAKYQPINAKLTSIAGLTGAANKLPYFTGANSLTTTDLSAYGRTLIDDADAATARTTLGLGTISTQDANSVALTGGSLTGVAVTGLSAPSAGSDAATKDYVDAATAGLSQKKSVRLATTAALTASYSNGTAGVGATLTNSGAQAALSLDGQTANVGDRVLVKNQASALQNGIYTVTNAGSGATNWVLTRATDFDAAAEISEGAYVIVEEGTADTGNLGTLWIQTNSGPFTVGTTSITWTQLIVAPQTKTFTGDVTGTGTQSIALTIGANKVLDTMLRQSAGLSVIGRSANTTGNVADMTAASDGNVMRRSGTTLGFGAIALASSGAVSGILGGANGGTGNGFFAVSGPASALKTFTFPNASATVLTTNAAVTAVQGGTGQTTTTTGDLLQGDASNTWSKLAAVATGNVLLSGGVGTLNSWGKVGLGTHVSGNLPVTNLNSGTGAAANTFWRGDGSWASPTPPTKQILTTSGTYNTPTNCKRIVVKMLGAGGGGGGYTSATNGGAGGDTSFNSIVAKGGTGGLAGNGGTVGAGGTGGTGTADLRIPGGRGANGIVIAGFGGGTALTPPTGMTAGNAFNGGSAAANSGAGGGGGGSNTANAAGAGPGGGGEYAEFGINSPSATYSYTIGAAGTGGTGVTSNGGAGGAGLIIVEEYY